MLTLLDRLALADLLDHYWKELTANQVQALIRAADLCRECAKDPSADRTHCRLCNGSRLA